MGSNQGFKTRILYLVTCIEHLTELITPVSDDHGIYSEVKVFDTPQVFNFLKVNSDAVLLPSWFNW